MSREAQQNERYVVVLHVTEDNDWPQRILVTDLLPAGFEIDNPSIVDSAQLSNFDWLERHPAGPCRIPQRPLRCGLRPAVRSRSRHDASPMSCAR